MQTEPTRQIHLDFHTSEHLPDIGGRFERSQFQHALKTGRVNLINVFAKCHHSWSYYPTKVGTPHPNLKIDLLGEQIAACHEIGVKAPIYYTVGWSAHDAETHPEWCVRTRDGEIAYSGPEGSWPAGVPADAPKPRFQWKHLCPSGEYHTLVMAQTDELCRLYPADGFWFDIYQPHVPCYCERCMKGMRHEGIDPADEREVFRYRAAVIRSHIRDLSDLITSRHPEASIYFNGLTNLARPIVFDEKLFDANTKNDLEDLPTTWGGYDKFPIRAKRFHREGKPIVAMSGKFHTAWGEFGGFKAAEAMRFEAASMIAFGASCNMGDHLHPLGQMDPETYRRIGYAFEYVEKIEEYGIGGLPAASLALVMSHITESDEGTTRMLLEEQIDFDVVEAGDPLQGYETVVVPSRAGLFDGKAGSLRAFIAEGGKVLFMGEGALDGSGKPVIDIGADYLGPGAFDNDFTIVDPPLAAEDMPSTPYLNYEPALRFRPKGAKVLAGVHEPYFSRTFGNYCGHQNTPNRPERAAHPAAFRNGNVLVLAHPVDRMYFSEGALAHRSLFTHALGLVHERPMIRAALPSAARVSLLRQAEEKRYAAHILYGPPLERGRCSVIEDLVPIRNVTLELRVPEKVTGLRLIPDGVPLDFEIEDGVVRCTIPEFTGHCAVIASYA